MRWTSGDYANGGYSPEQFSSMREDALRRVRQMQEQANRSLEMANQSIHTFPENPGNSGGRDRHAVPDGPPPLSLPSRQIHDDEPAHEPSPPQNPPQSPSRPPTILSLGDRVSIPFLKDFHLDSDTLILGGLAYMLLKEGADRFLIMALVYIMF